MIAGLQLKNSIKDNFNNIPLNVLDYVKQSCIHLLNVPDAPCINKTVSSVIAAIVGRGQVHNWPQVIFILIEQLKASNPVTLEVVYIVHMYVGRSTNSRLLLLLLADFLRHARYDMRRCRFRARAGD